MSTTDIIKIDDEAFGNLINLPRLYTANKASVAAAQRAADLYLKEFEGIDWTNVDLVALAPKLANITTLRTKFAGTIKRLNEERMPHADKMRSIVSAFVALENDVIALQDKCATIENAREVEVKRRNKAVTDAAALVTKNKQDRINRIAALETAFYNAYDTMARTEMTAMVTKFFDKAADDLDAYVTSLEGWSKKGIVLQIGNVTKNIPGVADELFEAIGKVTAPLTRQYTEFFEMAILRLRDDVPGRLLQLQAKAPVLTAEVKAAVVEQASAGLSQVVSSMVSATQLDAQRDTMNAAFDGAAAAPVGVKAKGTREKRMYKVDSIKGMQAIMQFWVTNSMKTLSMVELNKKLSFMRTAANAALNAGGPEIQAEGLSIVDDIRTTTRAAGKDDDNKSEE